MKRMILTVLMAGTALTATTAMAEGRGGREAPSFADLDVDGSGAITKEDMIAHAAARFAEIDTNGDGSVTVEEMVAHAQRDNDRLQSRMEKMIEKRDENGNGTLEAGEMSPEEDRLDKMFDRIDADENGEISEEEFEDMQGRRGGRGDRGGRHR